MVDRAYGVCGFEAEGFLADSFWFRALMAYRV